MADNSGIEWTHATWNPTTGCTKVSVGCVNCYAERLSMRLYAMGMEKYKNKFKLSLHEDALDIPINWKEPKLIFVNSMSDLFHKDVPYNFQKKVFDVMEKASWHTFQILTKRPENMLKFTKRYYRNKKKINNVWLGTSVENSSWKKRIDTLRSVAAKIRFLSLEPLLGPLGRLNLRGIHWIIVGGESGPNYRELKEEWVKEIKQQCVEKNVAFFFKQWGGFTPKANGNFLEGKVWDDYPVLEV